MNEENTTIMPPEKQIVQDDRDARAEELESAFSYDGYQVVRKELFAHLRDPAIVIRKDSITFNTACITGLEDVVYVHVMFNNDLKRIVVRGCDENDKDALRWCVAKPDKRKSRKMSCKPFATLVYQKMGWDSECRYKMLGYRITFEGETLYVFDLLVPEIFHEGQRKKNAVDSQDNAASTKPVNSRKGFYLDDIVGTFGVPVEEHRKESEVKQMDGYVSMGILTGKIAPDAGKDYLPGCTRGGSVHLWEVSNMQKTEQKTEQQAGLGMSFCEEEGRITVFRKTLEALEWPSHYRFLYNRKMKQIAVQACGAEESGAHRVGKPDESNSGEIKCMALVRMIYGDSGWDKKMSYRLIGRAFPQQRLVSFKITDAMQIENGRVLTEM